MKMSVQKMCALAIRNGFGNYAAPSKIDKPIIGNLRLASQKLDCGWSKVLCQLLLHKLTSRT